MQLQSTLLVLATAFMAGTNALNIPREAAPAPVPAGCNGRAWFGPDAASAEANCRAHCLDGCVAAQEVNIPDVGAYLSTCVCRGIP